MSIRDIAMRNDSRIIELASYIESKGLTKPIGDDDSIRRIFSRFSYLKNLLRNGSFPSISSLEDSVYKMYGIIENNVDSDNESAMISEMIKRATADLEKFKKKDK